ncbi:hypothetical protein CSUI_001680 [Cystoisospora suis]|uniref:Uncharacterized protein n=1 Tax=Cystoisospora suis TaxID=483139 RepID=A0A2C6LBQ4_9APIC|nr:hypothetical protein CSUI_001680 [Cystoisospora suis]
MIKQYSCLRFCCLLRFCFLVALGPTRLRPWSGAGGATSESPNPSAGRVQNVHCF